MNKINPLNYSMELFGAVFSSLRQEQEPCDEAQYSKKGRFAKQNH
jgi:hypothetical protein